MTPLAHAGHWLAQLLYLMPVAGDGRRDPVGQAPRAPAPDDEHEVRPTGPNDNQRCSRCVEQVSGLPGSGIFARRDRPMSTGDLRTLLDDVPDTFEIVLRRDPEWSPVLHAWRDACRGGRRGARALALSARRPRRLRRLPRRPGPRGRGPGRAGSDPDVPDQRLVAAVGGRRLGARLTALLAALREDQPARPDVPAPGAGEGLGALLVAGEIGGHRVQALVERRPARQHAAEQPERAAARIGERPRDEVARRVGDAQQLVERRREPLALDRRRRGQLAAQEAGRARLDRQRAAASGDSSPSSR